MDFSDFSTIFDTVLRMNGFSEHATAQNAQKFHQFLLDLGPAPFGVIQESLTEWIEFEKASG